MASNQNEFVRHPDNLKKESPPLADDHWIRIGNAVAPEVRREILRQVASGRKAIDVAKEFGVHHTTITRWKAEEKAEKKALNSPLPEPRADTAPKPPPRETGRFSKSFKEDVLAQVRSGRKVVDVARQYQVSDKTIYRWKLDAQATGDKLPDPKSTRPHTNASPIDEEHRAMVLTWKKDHPNMGPAQIPNQLKRFPALKLSREMIGRILTEAGIPLQKRFPRESDSDPAKNRFEMSRPNELWAVDFKEIWIHSERAQALFILDDFSRFCLGFALTQHSTAELAIETVRKAIQRYGRPERVLSDRGPQFHAWNGLSQFDKFLDEFLTDHTVIKANHAFTNGKIEAFFRSLEAEVLDVEEFASLKEAEEKIRAHITTYNFFRTHMGIGGLVPADRYFGMVEEAQRALEKGLQSAGPGLTWLRGIVSQEGGELRLPTILQIVLRDGKLELVLL